MNMSADLEVKIFFRQKKWQWYQQTVIWPKSNSDKTVSYYKVYLWKMSQYPSNIIQHQTQLTGLYKGHGATQQTSQSGNNNLMFLKSISCQLNLQVTSSSRVGSYIYTELLRKEDSFLKFSYLR